MYRIRCGKLITNIRVQLLLEKEKKRNKFVKFKYIIVQLPIAIK